MGTTELRPTTTDFQPTVIELDGSGLNDIASFLLLAEYWRDLTTQAQLDLILSILIRETRVQKPSIRIFPELSEELVDSLYALGFSVSLSDDLMFVVSWVDSMIRPKPKELDVIHEFMRHLPASPPRPANFSSKISSQSPLDK